MEVKAITKYARIAPKKARDLAREIQGKSVSEALMRDVLYVETIDQAFLDNLLLQMKQMDKGFGFSTNATGAGGS